MTGTKPWPISNTVSQTLGVEAVQAMRKHTTVKDVKVLHLAKMLNILSTLAVEYGMTSQDGHNFETSKKIKELIDGFDKDDKSLPTLHRLLTIRKP